MASSSSVPPQKTHAPQNFYTTDLPFKWGRDSRRRRSASSHKKYSHTRRLNNLALTVYAQPPPPQHRPDIPSPHSPRRDKTTVSWITLPPPRRDSPLLLLQPPPPPSQHRRDSPLLLLPPPPPPPQHRRHYSPRQDPPLLLLPPPPPQQRRHYSPRQDSPPDSVDCSAKLSSFIHRGSSSSSFRSSGPFFRRDSESEARHMSYSRNYHHHHQGSEGSNPYRGRDERNIRRDSELEPRRRGHRSRGYRRPHQGFEGGSNPHRERGTEKHEQKPKAEEADVAGVKRSSKILIKIPCKKIKPAEEKSAEAKKPKEKKPKEKKTAVEEPEKKNVCDEKEEGEINDEDDDKPKEEGEIEEDGEIKDKIDDEGGEVKDDGDDRMVEEGEKSPRVDEEGEKNPRMEEEVRVWSLRHRKPTSKGNEGAPSTSKNAEENKGKGGGEKKKKKPQKKKVSLNVSLTKQEIEEDFFAWTGAKPPRRPQKRAKHVQKSLDSLFPGLHLMGISVDSYKS